MSIQVSSMECGRPLEERLVSLWPYALKNVAVTADTSSSAVAARLAVELAAALAALSAELISKHPLRLSPITGAA